MILAEVGEGSRQASPEAVLDPVDLALGVASLQVADSLLAEDFHQVEVEAEP